MRKDVEYFSSKMGKIDGFGDLGTRLLELVNGKTTASDDKSTETSESQKQDDQTQPEK